MSRHLIREFVREHLFEQVRKKFAMSLPDDLLRLAHEFKAAGHQLYVVGGSVRDALQGKEPKDYDVATDAVPDQVVEILNSLGDWATDEVGRSFGVVRARRMTGDGRPAGDEYEIATFRQDIGKGRRPDAVKFTNIENDVKRRDLTINALFYDIDAGEIVDYVGGIDDIKNGVVRAVGDPKERFDEDRLRILRALRFAARMGNDLDPATSAAIKANNSLQGVSAERIRDEFLKGVKTAQNVGSFFDLIIQHGLWPQILPGLKVQDAFVTERDPSVMLALILDTNDPQLVAKRLNSLKYPANESSQASFLIRFKGLEVANAYRLRKAADATHVTPAQLEAYASERDLPRPKLLRAFLEYTPTVDGNDVMADGFSGAALGKELERRETELFKGLVGA
jgi:tRNA nucleotidyltransferase/poly(A) polymerase